MEDIKVNDSWQLTRAADGDAPVTNGSEEFLQRIKLESMTQEGELFYDSEYGWSLLDFVHSTDSELTQTAIRERIRSKMSKQSEVDISSLQIDISFKDDVFYIAIQFKSRNSREYALSVILDRIHMEVITE